MLLCCRVYKAQFLKRMGKLLDNLPDRDVRSTSANGHHSSISLRDLDLADSVRSTSSSAASVHASSLPISGSASRETLPKESTSSVQSVSATSRLETVQSCAAYVSTGDCLSNCASSHSTSRRQFHNNQQPSHCQSVQLPHDSSITRDFLVSSRTVTRDGLSCITAPSNTGGRSVTTPSSSDRGPVSAYDSGSHIMQAARAGHTHGVWPNC